MSCATQSFSRIINSKLRIEMSAQWATFALAVERADERSYRGGGSNEAQRRRAAYAAARESPALLPSARRHALVPRPRSRSQIRIQPPAPQPTPSIDVDGDVKDMIARAIVDGTTASDICQALAAWCATQRMECGEAVYRDALINVFSLPAERPALTLAPPHTRRPHIAKSSGRCAPTWEP